MNTINISLPDEMTSWVENEMQQGGFADASEFFRQLVHEAKLRREDEMRQMNLEALLIEGVESGDGEPVTAEWWNQLRSEVNDKLQAQGAAPVDWERGS